MLLSSIPQSVKPNEVYTAKDYIDYGWRVIPVSRNKIPLIKGWTTRQLAPEQFPAGCRISQVTGPQLDGSFIIGPEFDHKPEDGIDATANYHAFLERISDSLFRKIHITRSTGGFGYHLRVQVPRPVAGSIIRNSAGKKIGDLRSTGGHLIIQNPDKWLHGAPWTMETLTEGELQELLTALNYQAPVQPNTSTLDWGTAKAIDVSVLLTNGIPSRFRSTSQGAHYIKQSIPAHRTSEIRYALIQELIACEYTDEETAALALHLADLGASARKGITWLENDIERIITKVRASGPKPRRRAAQRTLGIEAPAERGSKHEAPYLFWLSSHLDGGKVLMSRPDRARSYGVSLRTLDRIEADLIARGKIRRGLSESRQVAWVEPVPEGTATSRDTHIDPTGDVIGVGGVGEGGNPAAPILAHVVEDAIEALGDSRIRKRRADVILGYVRAFIPDATPEHVAWHAKRATEWRRQRRADDALREKLAGMTTKQIKAKQRGLERKAADCHADGKPKQAWVWGRLSWFCQKELDKPERQARQERAKAIQQMLGGVE